MELILPAQVSQNNTRLTTTSIQLYFHKVLTHILFQVYLFHC